MFEQVRETGRTLRLMLGTDVVPDADRDDGGLAIGVDDDAQAVRQRKLLIGNIDLLHERGDRRGSGSLGVERRDERDRCDAGKREKLRHKWCISPVRLERLCWWSITVVRRLASAILAFFPGAVDQRTAGACVAQWQHYIRRKRNRG